MTNEDILYRIFHKVYLVKIPEDSQLSVEEQKIIGTPICGILEYDRDRSNRFVKVMLKLSVIIEKYSEGISIRLINRSDMVEIYQTLQSHLERWGNELQYGLNHGLAPLRDLANMEKFADSLYKVVRYELDHTLPTNPLFSTMNLCLPKRNRTLLPPKVLKDQKQQAEASGVINPIPTRPGPERTSIADIINSVYQPESSSSHKHISEFIKFRK